MTPEGEAIEELIKILNERDSYLQRALEIIDLYETTGQERPKLNETPAGVV